MNFTLRAFLWLLAAAAVMVVVGFTDALIDMLPIWLSPGPHSLVEGAVFWSVVAPKIWDWLARRVRVVPASEVTSTDLGSGK